MPCSTGIFTIQIKSWVMFFTWAMWWRWRSLSPPKDSFSQLVCLWEFGLYASDMSEYLHMICVWKSTQCVFTIQPPFPCVWTPRSQPDTMKMIMRTMTMMQIMARMAIMTMMMIITMVGTLKGDPKTGPLEGPPCERANCNKRNTNSHDFHHYPYTWDQFP